MAITQDELKRIFGEISDKYPAEIINLVSMVNTYFAATMDLAPLLRTQTLVTLTECVAARVAQLGMQPSVYRECFEAMMKAGTTISLINEMDDSDKPSPTNGDGA